MARRRRRHGHDLRRAKREREGGGHGSGGIESGEPKSGNAAPLGFKIPKRAIERIAGGAARHPRLQIRPVGAALDRGAKTFDLRQDAIDAFAVA